MINTRRIRVHDKTRTNAYDIAVAFVLLVHVDVRLFAGRHNVCEPSLGDLAKQRSGVAGEGVEGRDAIKDSEEDNERPVREKCGDDGANECVEVRAKVCDEHPRHQAQEDRDVQDILWLVCLENVVHSLGLDINMRQVLEIWQIILPCSRQR